MTRVIAITSRHDPKAVLQNFADRLRGARRDRGFATAAAAADTAGLDTQRWEAFEAATTSPNVDEMIQIGDALDISLDYLVSGAGLPRPGEVAAPMARHRLH